ncbi:LptF/LptG family permease [Zhouia spongiae]|uniref:LptF/LptG family permease n=2 Tax=Zhouia spongiae TaxID=2202721 RepID=A0ABY3YSK0_9FLAO|nr:LptF/LptG family permease [Zhouia spongiae]
MFIFVFQTIWMFIDELAGKGLDLIIIGKFLFYFMPNLVPQVLPLTVLLASIMTFGAFAENYEFAAMKASGISLQRAMRPLIIFIILLAIGTFFFANNVIPAAEYKSFNLRRNIAQVKPALAITEGVFSDIGDSNMNIKVDDKYGDNDRLLKTITIHKTNASGDNTTVIKAKEGELLSSEKSSILQLVLKDGNYYEDIQSKNKRDRKLPHAKANFETYTINVDLSKLNNQDLEEENGVNTHKMLTVMELRSTIDTLKKENKKLITDFGESIYKRSGIIYLNKFVNKPDVPDPVKDSLDTDEIRNEEIKKDTVVINSTQDIIALYDDYKRVQLFEYALNNVSNTVTTIEGKKIFLNNKTKIYMLHRLALNDKFALAFGCVILFFVGAPLGAIIRKGGIGLPMVIAIVLFLVYHFIGIFAKNYAEDGSIPPFVGSWLATSIMLPLGVLFTRRATADKAVMSMDRLFSNKLFQKISGFIKVKKNFFKQDNN